MDQKSVTVRAELDGKTFQRFALFDTFIRKQGWRRPALFAAILGASSVVCFALHERRGAVLLGAVLLVVALGLPGAYFLSYWLSLRARAKALDANRGQPAYTVRLDGERVRVTAGKEQADFPWGELLCAYRAKGCVYLYAAERRAFLLPDACGGERAWPVIRDNLPKEKVFDLRGEGAAKPS
ncbi:MAG: YcxB family protein [Clostridiales bacterium]|nr:YcxB family protein [Clostridiales bacterium]